MDTTMLPELTELTEEQAKGLRVVQAVNLDEVTNETIAVKIANYKNEPLTDDEGNPFCDENGKQRIGRVVSGTRTAKIRNIVPIDVYNEAMGLSQSMKGGAPGKEQMETMAELVLKVWKISEPFMTTAMLRESIDGLSIIALFTRFFNQGNRL